MSDADHWGLSPPSSDIEAAFLTGDQAKLILAGMLPGCTARRYDFPPRPDFHWGVELCFADQGPIMPKLSFSYTKTYNIVSISLNYISMLRDSSDYVVPFPGMTCIPVSARVDSGPAAIATTFRQAIDKVDFDAMIAAGTIERILTDYPAFDPWPCLNLAQCALYLGRDDQARSLLQDAIKYARQDGRPSYDRVIAKAERHLTALDTNPDSLRQELLAMIDYNWSHLKVIGAP
jgi:hypothetical protein